MIMNEFWKEKKKKKKTGDEFQDMINKKGQVDCLGGFSLWKEV